MLARLTYISCTIDTSPIARRIGFCHCLGMDNAIKTYRFAELAPGESLSSPTVCDCCEREGLKRTVKLINPAGRTVWFGTGCAARAMGLTSRDVKIARKSAEDRDAANQAAIRKAAHQAADSAWQAFLNSRVPGKERFEQIQALGGMVEARKLMKQLDK